MIAESPVTLRAWKAQRSGDHITIHGENIDSREQTKLTNIDSIEPPLSPADHHVVATGKNGIQHKLVFA